jgi:hypothetical protein
MHLANAFAWSDRIEGLSPECGLGPLANDHDKSAKEKNDRSEIKFTEQLTSARLTRICTKSWSGYRFANPITRTTGLTLYGNSNPGSPDGQRTGNPGFNRELPFYQLRQS